MLNYTREQSYLAYKLSLKQDSALSPPSPTPNIDSHTKIMESVRKAMLATAPMSANFVRVNTIANCAQHLESKKEIPARTPEPQRICCINQLFQVFGKL